jgi:predicted nucleic acid-binding protein
MKIVSNTGPLIGLAKIDCFSILKDIASEVLIPPMVNRELLGKIGIESERIDKALNDFIRVTNPKPLDLSTKDALANLDEGERQTIGLAYTFSENVLLLLDDRAGRIVAEKLNIPTIGLIGILLLAKEKGILENIGSLINELRNQGYWISDEVADIARHLAGENKIS